MTQMTLKEQTAARRVLSLVAAGRLETIENEYNASACTVLDDMAFDASESGLHDLHRRLMKAYNKLTN